MLHCAGWPPSTRVSPGEPSRLQHLTQQHRLAQLTEPPIEGRPWGGVALLVSLVSCP